MRNFETPSHLNTVLAAVLATSFLMSTTAGYAQVIIQIVNGAPELAEPTTGALLMGTLDATGTWSVPPRSSDVTSP